MELLEFSSAAHCQDTAGVSQSYWTKHSQCFLDAGCDWCCRDKRYIALFVNNAQLALQVVLAVNGESNAMALQRRISAADLTH